MDVKGRVSVPARFRRVLEAGDPDWKDAVADGQADARAQFTIVYGEPDQKFFECYTVETIYEVDDMIAEMSRGDDRRKELEDLYHLNSVEVEIDNDGRVMLTKDLRAKLGLEPKEMLLFTGSGDTFKIWKTSTFQAEQDAHTKRVAAKRPEGFDARSHLPPRRRRAESEPTKGEE